MLQNRTFHGTDVEHKAFDELVAAIDPDGPGTASVTRTEPNETGPLRVELAGRAWLINENGETEEVEV